MPTRCLTCTSCTVCGRLALCQWRALCRMRMHRATVEAASHEESSCGFWPGSVPIQAPAFYAYTLPTPEGLDRQPIRPSSAFWSPELSQFILLYDDVRQAEAPDDVLLEFLQSTYEAGATLAQWDRAALERGT